jgi:hypothetical protein
MERKTRGYKEEEVVAQLNRKSDLRIEGRQIKQLSQGKGDVGHGSKGKIDFLTKYCGYVHFYVKDFKK